MEKEKLTKPEIFMILMSIGCYVVAFPAQSVLLALAGLGFAIGAIGSYKQRHKK